MLVRGADLVVAETESEANIVRGTALAAIFELQINQAMARVGAFHPARRGPAVVD